MELYRSWMYEPLKGRHLSNRFVELVDEFVMVTLQHDEGPFEGHLRCPSKNSPLLPLDKPSPHASTSKRPSSSRAGRSRVPDIDPSSPLHRDIHWFYHSNVVRTVTASFTSFCEALCTAYSQIPLQARDRMRYTWDPSLDSQVCAAWEDMLKRRVRDIFYKVRIALIEGRFESVLWMPFELQIELLERQCMSEDFKAKYDIVMQNQAKGNATHATMSKSGKGEHDTRLGQCVL
ncbi:hypothetical protein AKJ16_DCAP21385 [Drosera capensis]